MIQKIRTSKISKIIAFYLALMIFLEVTAPMQAYALTGGPSQPEFDSFTPIDTSDMVDLSSGDFNYNIPIMDVGGYPINLAYNTGIGMDQESSWVGLGWDLNVGQITRQLRGLPDDFDGDEMLYENNMKPNVTVGGSAGIFGTAFGFDELPKETTTPPVADDSGTGVPTSVPTPSYSAGFGVNFNNYEGFTFSLTGGITYQIAGSLNVGANMTTSAEGVSVSPTISLSAKLKDTETTTNSLTGSVGTTLNSRKGIENYTISGTKSSKNKTLGKDDKYLQRHSASTGGSISFIDASYTPAKRLAMTSSNYMFNMNIEGEFWGVETGVKFSGFRTSQKIKDSERSKLEKAYGFEHTYNGTDYDILDFNREKDRTFTPGSTSLPVTNNTYDVYSIQGQGISGMFRPYKGQVGYVYDNYASDDSNGANLGVELGGGGGAHFGVDLTVTDAVSSTKAWRNLNPAISRFEEKKTGNRPDYEKVYFKNIGGYHVDNDNDVLKTQLGGYAPVRLGISGGKFSRKTDTEFLKKNISGTKSTINIPGAVKREKRVNRNQTIQKLTRLEALRYGLATQLSPYALPGKHDHHTAEIRVTKDGGERYIYGKAAYNIVKKEVTFDVSGNTTFCNEATVQYSGNDNSINNKANGDQYFNRVTTPSYAHTYLLTAVLSSDFTDLTKNGPSDDDLGTYTKFVYNDSKTKVEPYKWRVPYDYNTANFDAGLNTLDKDNKGSYLYGEKELVYIDTIVTKTHIAIFSLSARKDGYGVRGENGGGSPTSASKMYQLDKITLYSKPEFKAFGDKAIPIKVAHFEYDYSLCKNVRNNFNEPLENGKVNGGGKLTLKKVYFTYGKSNMGRYTPYKFNYSNYNPNYSLRSYDVWGNYKPTPSGGSCGLYSDVSNADFPFTDQNSTTANLYANAWLLQSVEMPSGGKIEVTHEADQYRYVQDKDVMQMFKVVGVGNTSTPNNTQINNNILYNGNDEANMIYIQLNKPLQGSGAERNALFKKQYIKNLENEVVYFRFLLNMSKPAVADDNYNYDYVSGYLQLQENAAYNVFDFAGTQYAAIPIKSVSKGDGISSMVNPIAKAGWNFGKKYLNRFVYTGATDDTTDDLEEIIKDIINTVPGMINIAKSPNKQLIDRKIASKFAANKSWIRLMQPEERKLGGGSRVKEIKLYDQWQVMTGHDTDDLYKQYYGQQYSYDTEDGHTSGVATYEPLGDKENPLVQPFYNKNDPGKLLAPEGENYIEKPFGECFYPSPKITYSMVTVNNLVRDKNNQTVKVKKHATGKVVTKFFTSYDYPTIADYTELKHYYDKSNILSGLLKLSVKDHLTMSQGFTVHTNDMDGKIKSQNVFAEGQTSPISGVEYSYDNLSQSKEGYEPNQGKLDNTITTIDKRGKIENKLVGVDYDVINDFRQSKTVTTSAGIHVNTAFLPITIFIVVIPTPLPSFAVHENLLKTAVTTKVIHTSAILRVKRVFDGGSSMSTKDLAWDAETGEVLLTQTVNEYNDKYYSFNFPAYWGYKGMSQAANNIDITWKLKPVIGTTGKYQLNTPAYTASDFLTEGDELWINPSTDQEEFKAYVVDVDGAKFTLITEDGVFVTVDEVDNGDFTVIRSGHRNMQTASMASITSMLNPLNTSTGSLPSFNSQSWQQYRIINAAAIEYKDIWAAQCECRLPKMKFDNGNLVFNYETSGRNKLVAYNPYKYNIKGNWRPTVSYAYLTSRNYTDNASPRKTGYFNNYSSFYNYDPNSNKWVINYNGWTKASEVTQYNPYGFEVENVDALNRHSSALYGYNFRFPIAVASNTKYKELAYDGFEDYDFNICDTTSHFSFHGNFVPNKVTISSSQAHTGKKSIKLAPQSKAVLKKQIVPCNP